jgi:hypothetical protein
MHRWSNAAPSGYTTGTLLLRDSTSTAPVYFRRDASAFETSSCERSSSNYSSARSLNCDVDPLRIYDVRRQMFRTVAYLREAEHTTIASRKLPITPNKLRTLSSFPAIVICFYRQYALCVTSTSLLQFPLPQHLLTRILLRIAGAGSSSDNPASIAKREQKQEEYEARKEHSNSGSNTHSGQGMEYQTRKTHSSRKDEEWIPAEKVHGGWSGNHKKV